MTILGTLTLKVDGDSLSGSMAGPQGTESFEGGKVDGNSATWTVNVTQPMAMDLKFDSTIDGDKISGNQIIEFRNKFEGRRFRRKSQLRELLGEENYDTIKDFITIHSWTDPYTFMPTDVTPEILDLQQLGAFKYGCEQFPRILVSVCIKKLA